MKYRVGYATGVFDLFHVGHLNILKNAKENCNFLIVGVSTDELVKSYKGYFPIIKFEQRIEIIKNIKFVNKVVPQKNLDKLEAWKNLKYDVIFLGDDWKGTKKWEKIENELNKVAVDVVYFHYTKNISSTDIKNRIRSENNKTKDKL